MGRLSRREIAEAVRKVEREQRFRFPAQPRVVFGRKQTHEDFGEWEAWQDDRGRVRDFRIVLASDEPKEAQRAWLEHELRESAFQFRGLSPTEAHRRALKAEKRTLLDFFRKDPKKYGDRRGTPYVKTLFFRRKLLRRDAKRSRGAASPAPRGGVRWLPSNWGWPPW